MREPISEKDLDRAMARIETLSSVIGPRPPGSDAERLAAELIASELKEASLETHTEHFAAARSFGPSYLFIFGLALGAWALQRRSRASSTALGASAATIGLAESRFSPLSPLRFLRRRRSQNVWASIEPLEEPQGTICLVSHMDSSRSGLMFHPKLTPHLGNAVAAVSAGVFTQALGPLLARLGPGRALLCASRALVMIGAGLVLERELRGQDVPGANDNASGVAACLALADHFEQNRPQRSRIVILVTGSEESGVFGMREFLDSHDTSEWLFLNFDGVGADAPLRVLSREGGPLSNLKADPELLALAAEIGADRPDLSASPLDDGSGLPYDATPILQSGGRAMSIVNQEGAIPDYHWPTDTATRISRPALAKAIEFGAELVGRLDRGRQPPSGS